MFILNVISRFASSLFGAGNRPTQSVSTPDPLQSFYNDNCKGPEALALAIKEDRVLLKDLEAIGDLLKRGVQIHLDVRIATLLKLRDTYAKMQQVGPSIGQNT